MLRNDAEYKAAVKQLEEQDQRLESVSRALESRGLDETAIEQAMAAMLSFRDGLKEEIHHYERTLRGELNSLENLQGLGHMLVSARIAAQISQRELAGRLGIHESQVSRDERNEYHGISIERATKVLEALGIKLRSEILTPVALAGSSPSFATNVTIVSPERSTARSR